MILEQHLSNSLIMQMIHISDTTLPKVKVTDIKTMTVAVINLDLGYFFDLITFGSFAKIKLHLVPF